MVKMIKISWVLARLRLLTIHMGFYEGREVMASNKNSPTSIRYCHFSSSFQLSSKIYRWAVKVFVYCYLNQLLSRSYYSSYADIDAVHVARTLMDWNAWEIAKDAKSGKGKVWVFTWDESWSIQARVERYLSSDWVAGSNETLGEGGTID